MVIGRNGRQTASFAWFYVLTFVHNKFITPRPAGANGVLSSS
jgi:hypothetical protein